MTDQIRHRAVDIARALGRPEPTAEQVAVIEAPLEPLLVVAGAGSGKTETMAARVVYLIANGLVPPESVLGLTFTRKAAGELSERVRHRLRAVRRVLGERGVGPGQEQSSALVAPTISTYNSYAAGLVRDHALRLGLEPSARLLGEAGRWQLAHDVVERWTTDLEVDLAPSTVTQAVLDLAGNLAEHLRTPAELRAEAERLAELVAETPVDQPLRAKERDLVRDVAASLRFRARLADLVEEFGRRKQEADTIDFADQVALAARLAREVPEVGAGERARFRVVLLDEYQDTSVAQLELLRHLFGAGSPEGAGHPVTAVGDPHQSIYGWRGASAGGLARFPEQFPVRVGAAGSTPAPVAVLATSWRNDHAVLDAANLVAEPLRRASGPGLELPVLVPRAGAGTGGVECRYLETQQEEAAVVAETIHDAWTAGRGEGSGPAGVTAAVLCRKRSQFPLLHGALVARGLPVEVVGLGGLLGTPEVVDLVAALEAAHDPSRGDSLMRLLTGPRARLGLADLHALSDWSAELAGSHGARSAPATDRTDAAGAERAAEADVVDERSIVDALDELPRPGWVSRRGRSLTDVGRERLADLAGVLRSIRAHTFLPVVDLVAETEQLLGLDIEVATRPGLSPAGARANLDAFRTVAASFSDATDTATLGAFLAWLEAAQREERGLEAPVADVNPDAVQLMTVHAAKGLEWDVVAVPGMVDGGFPSLRTPADGRPVDSGWLTDRGALPTSLRGDRDSLPDVDVARASDLADLAARFGAYRVACGAHQVAEERRLAYVALTRARHRLLVTGSWWREGATPRDPSAFLVELVGEPPDGAWADDPRAPGPDGRQTKPVKPDGPAVEAPVWPTAAVLEDRQAAVDRAARAVERAMTSRSGGGPAATTQPGVGVGPDLPDSPHRDGPGVSPDRDGPDLSLDRDGPDLAAVADLLLQERDRGAAERSTVHLPAHLSASAVVRLAGDPQEFARQLRRPVPLAPSVHARRGTDFHAWVESWYGSAALVDVDGLPGADDDSVGADPALDALKEQFLASPWAHRTPIAVEVDVETPVAGLVVRSRIDAVFVDPDDPEGVVVVDWKTGRPPTDPESVRNREIQLGVYRLAWSRWHGVPLDKVAAAFFYVATGQTVRPRRMPEVAEIEEVLRQPA